MIGQDLAQNIAIQSNALTQQLNQNKWYASQAEIDGILKNYQNKWNELPEINKYYIQGILHQLNLKVTQPRMNDQLFLLEIKTLKMLFDYNLVLQSKLGEIDLFLELDNEKLDNQRLLFINSNENVQRAIEQDKRLLSVEMLQAENARLKELLKSVYDIQDIPEEPKVEPEVRDEIRNDKPKPMHQDFKSNFSIIDALMQFLSDTKKPNFNPISSIKNLVGGVLGFVFNVFSKLIQGMFGVKAANQFGDTAQDVFNAMANMQEQAPQRTKPAPTHARRNAQFTPAYDVAQQPVDEDEIEEDGFELAFDRHEDNGVPVVQKMEV